MNSVLNFCKKNKVPLFIFAFSFILRILLNLTIQGLSAPLQGDAVAYDELGRNLLQGRGYILSNIGPTAYRFPLLPLCIAFLYKIFGTHEIVARIFISFLDSLLAAGIYLLGKKIYSERTGIFSALAYAASPFAIGECLQISTEVLFTLLLFSSIAYLYFNQKSLDLRKSALAGGLLALATLTRSVSLYLGLLIAAVLFLQAKNKQKALGLALTFILSFFLVLSPWAVRNTMVFGKPLLSGTGTGEVLLGSYNPDVFNDARRSGTWYYGNRTQSFPVTRDELGRDQAMKKQALRYIKAYWRKLPILELNKFKYFWNFIPNLAEGTNWKRALLGTLFFGIFLPFFFLGLKDVRRKDLAAIWTVIFYFNLIALLTYGSIRMRFPINPYVYIISSNYMLIFIFRWFQKPQRRKR